LVLSAIQVEVVEANPFWIFHQIEPRPDAIPPKITIFSPQNNTTYSSEKITLSFYVDKPKLDMNGSSIDIQSSSIINITYTLDDKTEQAFTIWKNGSASSSGISNFNTSLNCPALPAGNHYLTVYAEAVVFVGGLDIFFINGSSTIFFSTQLLKPSPTSTPIEVGGNNSIILSNSKLIIEVIIGVFVFLVVGLLLKRNHEVKR
jgi:hypothetical protein